VAHLTAQANTLSARAGEFGALNQKVDAQRLQLESLKNGVKGVTTALESLKSALEALEGQVDEATLDALLADVEALKSGSRGSKAESV
jgi:hypothetical protein